MVDSVTLKKELLREFGAEICAFLAYYIKEKKLPENHVIRIIYSDMIDMRNGVIGKKYQTELELDEVLSCFKYVKSLMERL